MSINTLSHEERLAQLKNRNKRDVRRSLIRSWLLAASIVWVGGLLFILDVSGVNFAALVTAEVFCILLTTVSFFDLGCCLEKNDFEPILLESDHDYNELSKEFAAYKIAANKHSDHVMTGHAEMVLFLRARAPSVLAEFDEWKKEQEKQSVEEAKT